jgi:hypothetical protein
MPVTIPIIWDEVLVRFDITAKLSHGLDELPSAPALLRKKIQRVFDVLDRLQRPFYVAVPEKPFYPLQLLADTLQ